MQGSASHSAAQDWFSGHTLGDTDGGPDEIAALRADSGLAVTVCLPALNEQDTIGAICERIDSELVQRGIVDQLLVVDSGSTDATAARATDAGATVWPVAQILPELPMVPGKGEALWRSLAVATGDVIVYLDADVSNFDERFVLRLVEPLLRDPEVSFVKAFYERPLGSDGTLGGGRVTELVARPLLNLFFPELTGFLQPLAGEYAARTDLLRRLPFFCGYAVEIGLLIDTLEEVGLNGMVQVDLGERKHRNRPTATLGPMAFEITKALLVRAESAGRAKFAGEPTDLFATFVGDSIQVVDVALKERPPLAAYSGEGSSGGGVGGFSPT